MRTSILITLLLLAGGCEKYEFDLIEPADLAGHIGRDRQTVIKRDELEYRMQAVEGRLLIHIVNSTDDAIELVGPESSAVDPAGQSHPFRGQSIAPHSFIKLILPPMLPYYRSGPTFGIGIGVHADRGGDSVWGGDFWDREWVEPTYFSVVDETDTLYWDWQGESDARVRLTFRRGREVFHHNFWFKRVKAK